MTRQILTLPLSARKAIPKSQQILPHDTALRFTVVHGEQSSPLHLNRFRMKSDRDCHSETDVLCKHGSMRNFSSSAADTCVQRATPRTQSRRVRRDADCGIVNRNIASVMHKFEGLLLRLALLRNLGRGRFSRFQDTSKFAGDRLSCCIQNVCYRVTTHCPKQSVARRSRL